MITFARTRKHVLDFKDASIAIEFNVPTAEEFEELRGGALKDTEIFRRFVTKVSSDDVEGWKDGIDAEDVVKTPGTYAIVAGAAVEVVSSGMLEKSTKN